MADNPRIDDLRRRVQKDPASIAFAQLAEEHRRAGQLQEAVEVCRAGLAIHPAYLSARVTLGRAFLELNQLDDAMAELQTVLKSAPENLAAIRGLAEIYHRRGALAEALVQYRAALALARNDPDLEATVNELAHELASKGRPPVSEGPPPDQRPQAPPPQSPQPPLIIARAPQPASPPAAATFPPPPVRTPPPRWDPELEPPSVVPRWPALLPVEPEPLAEPGAPRELGGPIGLVASVEPPLSWPSPSSSPRLWPPAPPSPHAPAFPRAPQPVAPPAPVVRPTPDPVPSPPKAAIADLESSISTARLTLGALQQFLDAIHATRAGRHP